MISIINISQFNEIVKGIKAMKADFVYVKGNTLYGTDNNCVTLKTYTMETSVAVSPFTIITKTLSTAFYNGIIDVNIIIDTDINKMYCASNKSAVDDYQEMITLDLNHKIESIIASLSFDIHNPMGMIVDFGDITDDEYFERFKTIKSGDGADLYIPNGNNNYQMYLYSGAIPMVKADRVCFKAYDLGTTFIGNFTIIKKKTSPINLYFRFVKLMA